MKDLKQISSKIKELVTPYYDQWINDQMVILDHLAAVKRSDAYRDIKGARGASASVMKFYYLTDMGFTKSQMNRLGYSDTDNLTYYQKQVAAKLLKIDLAVAKKINFDVTSIETIEVNHGKDGFVEGSWKLNNSRIFSFETFYAGGHNIQCLHVRTRYNLSKEVKAIDSGLADFDVFDFEPVSEAEQKAMMERERGIALA